jgi:hypothetical protein
MTRLELRLLVALSGLTAAALGAIALFTRWTW